MKAIYLLGMSHIMPVLRACSPAKDGHYSHFGNGIAPSFIDWPTLPGSLPAPLKVASIYVGHIAPFWGPVFAALGLVLPAGGRAARRARGEADIGMVSQA